MSVFCSFSSSQKVLPPHSLSAIRINRDFPALRFSYYEKELLWTRMLPDCHMTQKNQQKRCTRRGSFIPTQQNTNQIIIMTRKTNGVTFVQYVDDYSDSARRTDTSHSVSSPSREKNNVFHTYFHTIHSLIATIFPLSHHS